MNLFSSPYRDPSLSSLFRGNLGDQVKGRSKKKAKIVDRSSLSSSPESACSQLQYEPFLFSVACSKTELSTSGGNWEIRKRIVYRKAQIVDRGYLCSEPESTGCKLQCDPYLFSLACS